MGVFLTSNSGNWAVRHGEGFYESGYWFGTYGYSGGQVGGLLSVDEYACWSTFRCPGDKDPTPIYANKQGEFFDKTDRSHCEASIMKLAKTECLNPTFTKIYFLQFVDAKDAEKYTKKWLLDNKTSIKEKIKKMGGVRQDAAVSVIARSACPERSFFITDFVRFSHPKKSSVYSLNTCFGILRDISEKIGRKTLGSDVWYPKDSNSVDPKNKCFGVCSYAGVDGWGMVKDYRRRVSGSIITTRSACLETLRKECRSPCIGVGSDYPNNYPRNCRFKAD